MTVSFPRKHARLGITRFALCLLAFALGLSGASDQSLWGQDPATEPSTPSAREVLNGENQESNPLEKPEGDSPSETPDTPSNDDPASPAEEAPAPPEASETSDTETSSGPAVEPSSSTALPVISPEMQALIDSVSDERLNQIFAGDDPQNLAELVAMQAHVQEIVRRVSPSVVSIEVGPSQGTGVMVTNDGFILTAGHVIMRPKQRANIRFTDGAPIPAETLGINRNIDSGLVRMKQQENWPYVEMGDSSQLKPGQWVLTIGHPGGFQPERGLVVRLGRVLSVASTGIRTDCALVGGDSGGPLFDMNGKVVGINSRIGDQIVKNIHVPVNTFAETWDRLVQADAWGSMGNLVRASWIGISLDADSEFVVISALVSGGPAELAGMEVGDRVVQFNGMDVTNRASLSDAVSRTPAYELITVVVRRGDRQIALELETGEK